MDFKKKPFQSVSLVLISLILIILIYSTISSSGENKRLKRAQNKNNETIKLLENEKNTILELLKEDSVKISAQNLRIKELEKLEDSLINNLKTLKHERTIFKNAYFNHAVSERVRIFSELATKTDSI